MIVKQLDLILGVFNMVRRFLWQGAMGNGDYLRSMLMVIRALGAGEEEKRYSFRGIGLLGKFCK
jgi:hypothetical protein